MILTAKISLAIEMIKIISLAVFGTGILIVLWPLAMIERAMVKMFGGKR